jgi:hypothetical protein
VNNVAPDPGSCTRETLVAARQGPEFFAIRSRAGRNGADRRNGEPTGKDNLLSLNRGVLPAPGGWMSAPKAEGHPEGDNE